MVDYVNLVNQALLVGTIILVVMVAAALIYFLYIRLQFKHKVRLRVNTNQGKYIIDDWARSTKVRGVKYWKLWRLKIKVPVPPSEAIDITQRGKYVVEGYMTENDDIVWLKDRGAPDKPFESLTTNQRNMLIDEIIDAKSFEAKKLLDYAPQIAGGLTVIIVLIVALIFYGEIVKPAMQVGSQNLAIQQENKEILQEFKELVRGGQFIGGDTNATHQAPD